jgi:uncharacterized FlgJ-related protein
MKRLNLRLSLTSWRGLRLLLLPLVLLFALWTVLKYLTKMISKGDIVSYSLGELVKDGISISQAKLIISQAAHETGNFTSSLYHSNNNMFGMKYAGQFNSLGEKNGYADYVDVAQCLKDYVSYYKRRGYEGTYGSVVTFVTDLKKNGYFEADTNEYIKGVDYFYKKYFNA